MSMLLLLSLSCYLYSKLQVSMDLYNRCIPIKFYMNQIFINQHSLNVLGNFAIESNPIQSLFIKQYNPLIPLPSKLNFYIFA